MRTIEQTMRLAGGVARATTLQAAGHSRYHLRAAIEQGRVHRVRRNWLALPGADPELVAAASMGAVLSCITQARRLGLWVLEHPHLHVAWSASMCSRVCRSSARLARCSPP
ncbi:hypothetical protein ACWGST_13410 [Agromyces sp. NPDC055520]